MAGEQRKSSLGSGGGSPRRVNLIFEALRSGGSDSGGGSGGGSGSGSGGGTSGSGSSGPVHSLRGGSAAGPSTPSKSLAAAGPPAAAAGGPASRQGGGKGGGGGAPAHRAALAAIERKFSRHGDAVLDEYDRVCRPSALDETPCSVAEQRAHSGLNRYFNVLPFDFNRVRLQGADSDYINASLLRSKPGEAPPWAYIATQAPLPATAAHFWACVWHQHSSVVLMLTREVEAGTRKCHAYLPPAVGVSIPYGDFAVSMESQREVNEDVTHRALTLTRGGKESRRVDHYQYHAWPDHGVPRTTRPLRALARLLEDGGSHTGGPAIVHCSAGIGRTGTFCALDIALRRLRALHPEDTATAEEAVKLKRIVSRLRKQRAGMVQTPDQYMFCYQALKEELEDVLAGQEAVGGVDTPLAGAPHPGAHTPAASAPAAATTPSPAQQPQQRQPAPAEGLFKSSSALPVPLSARQGSGRAAGDPHSADEAEHLRGSGSPGSSLSGQSPPRSPTSAVLRRRPSGPGGWAGLMGGASTASDPWASLHRDSTGGGGSGGGGS